MAQGGRRSIMSVAVLLAVSVAGCSEGGSDPPGTYSLGGSVARTPDQAEREEFILVTGQEPMFVMTQLYCGEGASYWDCNTASMHARSLTEARCLSALAAVRERTYWTTEPTCKDQARERGATRVPTSGGTDTSWPSP